MKRFFKCVISIFLEFFCSTDDFGKRKFQVSYFWSTAIMVLFFLSSKKFLSDITKNASMIPFLLTLAGLITGILATYKMGKKKNGGDNGI